MYGCYGDSHRGYVKVASGLSNGRSTHDLLTDGRYTLSGINDDGKPFQRIVILKDGEIADNRLKVDGKTVHHIVYGQFESRRSEKGNEVVRFRKGSGTGKHGKAKKYEKLFGCDGVCHSWYKNGRLVRQKFYYDNRKLAYDYNAFKKSCIVKDPNGEVKFTVKGVLDGRMNAYWGSHSVFHKSMDEWFNTSKPFEVIQNDKPYYCGLKINGQKAGEWFEGGKQYFYEHGVALPMDLYLTPSDKLDPKQILALDNAQARMALMARIGPDRLFKIGKVIHKDGDMRLYDIPRHDVRILRVKCPTTKSFYFLRVPKDSTKCEQARQWTFYVGDGFNKPIKFAVET